MTSGIAGGLSVYALKGLFIVPKALAIHPGSFGQIKASFYSCPYFPDSKPRERIVSTPPRSKRMVVICLFLIILLNIYRS
jgi:hypothetical protein